MKNNFILTVRIVVLMFVFLTSCEKYLDVKSAKSLVIPATLEDYRAILDNAQQINYGAYAPQLELATDDFEVDYSFHSYLSELELDIYKWKPYYEYDQTNTNIMWTNPYKVVFLANTVLEGIEKLGIRSVTSGGIRGEAYFHRAFSHFILAQVYTAPYDPERAPDMLGLPLRMTADFNAKSYRATLKETYDAITSDLKVAIGLLPHATEYTTRPTKAAAYSALGRVFLYMEDYRHAELYADSALMERNGLLDFNNIDTTLRISFDRFNDETYFFAYSVTPTIFTTSVATISNALLSKYASNDLRKPVYFHDEANGKYSFKGAFYGNTGAAFFVGPTVSEMLLISAECKIRDQRNGEAKILLKRLLENRYDKDMPLPDMDAMTELLHFLMEERRRELPYRGLRWMDLRRLNKDQRFSVELERIIDTGTAIERYVLPANDPRYVFLIPQRVVDITGIEQNGR